MKATAIYTTSRIQKLRYPNAATRQEIVHKLLDTLLVGAIGAGAAASLLFILVLF